MGDHPRALDAGRPGKLRAALRRSSTYAALDELDRVMAERIAASVDRAARDGDTKTMLAAWRELGRLVSGSEISNGDSGNSGAAIRQLYVEPPTVGDSA